VPEKEYLIRLGEEARRMAMNIFEMKNAELVTEFDRFIREHPDFSDKIPNGALVVMLVEGDEGFITSGT
jgi:Family of unknown function (DUF5647)